MDEALRKLDPFLSAALLAVAACPSPTHFDAVDMLAAKRFEDGERGARWTCTGGVCALVVS